MSGAAQVRDTNSSREVGRRAFLGLTAAAADIDQRAAWQSEFYASMRPYASGQAYQNYIDPSLTNWRQAYYGANYERLIQVKAAYDPDHLFQFQQAIG
jgi:FAD/FMN-containing dehydrogenase